MRNAISWSRHLHVRLFFCFFHKVIAEDSVKELSWFYVCLPLVIVGDLFVLQCFGMCCYYWFPLAREHRRGPQQPRLKVQPVLYAELDPTKQQDNCCICCETLSEKELQYLPCCNHAVHSVCLLPWFEESPTCPLCRKNLKT